MSKKVNQLEEKIRQMEADIQCFKNDVVVFERVFGAIAGQLDCSSNEVAQIPEALEKNRPMKVRVGETAKNGMHTQTRFYCPRCGDYTPGIVLKKYCSECGQALDWDLE